MISIMIKPEWCLSYWVFFHFLRRCFPTASLSSGGDQHHLDDDDGDDDEDDSDDDDDDDGDDSDDDDDGDKCRRPIVILTNA